MGERTMATHTPGPWKQHAKDQKSVWSALTKKEICAVSHDETGEYAPPEKEALANARLIAACPTMYEYIRLQAENGDEHAAKIITAIG